MNATGPDKSQSIREQLAPIVAKLIVTKYATSKQMFIDRINQAKDAIAPPANFFDKLCEAFFGKVKKAKAKYAAAIADINVECISAEAVDKVTAIIVNEIVVDWRKNNAQETFDYHQDDICEFVARNMAEKENQLAQIAAKLNIYLHLAHTDATVSKIEPTALSKDLEAVFQMTMEEIGLVQVENPSLYMMSLLQKLH